MSNVYTSTIEQFAICQAGRIIIGGDSGLKPLKTIF